MKTKVVLKTRDDLTWGFDDQGPSISLGQHGGWIRSERVDPFPAYHHDPKLVTENIKKTVTAFPIDWPVTYYLLSNEFLSRTNAYAAANGEYNQKKQKNVHIPYIVFSGKRIPIMPAMTRYLVPHEYGHIVEDWIAEKRGIKDIELITEYAKMRKLKFPKSYGGFWDQTPGEIFANDFRIIVCGAEEEFWPHPCSHPKEDKRVLAWWDDVWMEI